jgi:hypothetical protein
LQSSAGSEAATAQRPAAPRSLTTGKDEKAGA